MPRVFPVCYPVSGEIGFPTIHTAPTASGEQLVEGDFIMLKMDNWLLDGSVFSSAVNRPELVHSALRR